MNFKRCFTEWRQYCQLWQIFIMFKHKKIPLIISTRTNTQNRLVCHELKLRTNVRSWFRWIHFSQKMTHCFFHILFVLEAFRGHTPSMQNACTRPFRYSYLWRCMRWFCASFVQRDVRATCNPPIQRWINCFRLYGADMW